MPTATLTISIDGTVSGSGLVNRAGLYLDDGLYFQCNWPQDGGDKWAGYTTDASLIIPLGASLLYWRIKYRVYLPNWLTAGYPLPKVWYAQYTTGVGIGDYDLTGTETQYTWPNPEFHPLGSSLSGVSILQLDSIKFGGTRSSSATDGNLYYDELIIEIDYANPANSTFFFGENF